MKCFVTPRGNSYDSGTQYVIQHIILLAIILVMVMCGAGSRAFDCYNRTNTDPHCPPCDSSPHSSSPLPFSASPPPSAPPCLLRFLRMFEGTNPVSGCPYKERISFCTHSVCLIACPRAQTPSSFAMPQYKNRRFSFRLFLPPNLLSSYGAVTKHFAVGEVVSSVALQVPASGPFLRALHRNAATAGILHGGPHLLHPLIAERAHLVLFLHPLSASSDLPPHQHHAQRFGRLCSCVAGETAGVVRRVATGLAQTARVLPHAPHHPPHGPGEAPPPLPPPSALARQGVRRSHGRKKKPGHLSLRCFTYPCCLFHKAKRRNRRFSFLTYFCPKTCLVYR